MKPTTDTMTRTGQAVIWLGANKPPLTMNDRGRSRGAAFARATKVKNLRTEIMLKARAANLPKDCDHVSVELHYLPRDNRRRDTDNLVATLKPICDGLAAGKPATLRAPAQIGYGLVPDDTPQFMSKPEPVIHAHAKGDTPAMWLIIKWVKTTI